jgi:hypothetical protein
MRIGTFGEGLFKKKSDEKGYFGMELVQLFTNLEGIKRDYE